MPAEVISLTYLFCPPEPISLDEADEPATELPFRYNAIHDVESIWWLGVWMMFFKKPKGYSEENNASLHRQLETGRVFPGDYIHYDARLLYVKDPVMFRNATRVWMSKKFAYAVKVFDVVRAMLSELYQEVEGTFFDGFTKLSAKADRCNTHEAFPGGPTEDIYEPIKDTFLMAKLKFNNDNIELESFKVHVKGC